MKKSLLIGFVATFGLLALVGCQGENSRQGTTEVELRSPSLDRVYSRDSGPRAQTEFQLLETYPEGLWLTGIDLECRPKDTLAQAEVRLFYPERHYRFLGLKQGPANVFRASDPATSFRMEESRAFPIRSNEPLVFEVQFQNQDPYRAPVQATCRLKLYWKSVDDQLTPVRPSDSQTKNIPWEPENDFKGWPDQLR